MEFGLSKELFIEIIPIHICQILPEIPYLE